MRLAVGIKHSIQPEISPRFLQWFTRPDPASHKGSDKHLTDDYLGTWHAFNTYDPLHMPL